MTTPLATVANSIIEFILSLLRDPAALEELKKDPEAALLKNKVSGICAEDVRTVAPVVYDRPDVVPKVNPTPPPPSDNDVVNELTRITTNWTTIDNRSTIVDQSVNQNIWTEGGDVTQIFDQTAGVASGDGATAAGDDIDTTGTPDDDIDGDETPVLPDPLPTDDEASGDGTDAESDGSADEAEVPVPAGDEPVPAPAEQVAAATEDVMPPEAVDATASAVEQTAPEPTYEAPPVEVEEEVWTEPEQSVELEQVAYADELGEEQ